MVKRIVDIYKQSFLRSYCKTRRILNNTWGIFLFVLIIFGVIFGLVVVFIFLGILTLIVLGCVFLIFPIISSLQYQKNVIENVCEIEVCVVAVLRNAKTRKNQSDGWMTSVEVAKSVRRKMKQKCSMWGECSMVLEDLRKECVVERDIVSWEKIDFTKDDDQRSRLAYRLIDMHYNPRLNVKKRGEC